MAKSLFLAPMMNLISNFHKSERRLATEGERKCLSFGQAVRVTKG